MFAQKILLFPVSFLMYFPISFVNLFSNLLNGESKLILRVLLYCTLQKVYFMNNFQISICKCHYSFLDRICKNCCFFIWNIQIFSKSRCRNITLPLLIPKHRNNWTRFKNPKTWISFLLVLILRTNFFTLIGWIIFHIIILLF